MKVNYALVNEFFRAFHIQRWNDRVRPMDFTEMDKHAHKMIIAYCLGKYEESAGNAIDWDLMIKHGIYELLRRIIISDIKSPIYREFKKHTEVFQQLNNYIFKVLEPKIDDETIKQELRLFLDLPDKSDDLTQRVLDAAHIYSSYWEFQLLYHLNPNSYQNIKIETELLNSINNFNDLEGIKQLVGRHTITNFVDMCGEMRFQIRWAQTPRVPKTSVLGHCLLVAIISYLFTRDLPNCPKRLYNNFFGGLFHDLPEAVTRDILSPIKKSSPELDNLIAELEQELAEQEIYPLVEKSWIDELRYFTKNEFSNKIKNNGQIIKDIKISEISEQYNQDNFCPMDGELIRAADRLSAFLEAWNSCSVGIKSEELIQALSKIKEEYEGRELGGIAIMSLYSSFNINF